MVLFLLFRLPRRCDRPATGHRRLLDVLRIFVELRADRLPRIIHRRLVSGPEDYRGRHTGEECLRLLRAVCVLQLGHGLKAQNALTLVAPSDVNQLVKATDCDAHVLDLV